MVKKIFGQLNLVLQCKKYGLPVIQCPQFLFLIMGLFIIFVSLVSYSLGTIFIEEPAIVALIDLALTTILLVMTFIIVRSFERTAEASKMKSDFISIVSHQLRSPLTNIKWIMDFLTSAEAEASPKKRKEYFGHMDENVARMVELVDELMFVSKIEQGTFPIRKKKSSIVDLIKEIVRRSAASAEAGNIEVSVSIEENIPEFEFDPVLIKFVLENLFDNSIRYTQPGGKVKIRMENRDCQIYFQISDTGVGIPKNEQRFIFQKFFRADNPLKEKTKGSGLGLFITKSIVEKSGGKIWFNSEEGKGTTFFLVLPK